MGEYKFELVRLAKIRQHKFLNKLNELGYLLNIDSIESYVTKIVSTKFYVKKTKQLQESLRAVPIYVILNGQGNIVLANSTDQLATNTKDLKSLLYNFCGNFDTLSEKNSQLSSK